MIVAREVSESTSARWTRGGQSPEDERRGARVRSSRGVDDGEWRWDVGLLESLGVPGCRCLKGMKMGIRGGESEVR
jgi:hypothetical protein